MHRGRRYLAVDPRSASFLQQPRKFHQILTGFARGIAAESRKPLRDVSGVADLAHLTVADHIDADGNLPPHHLRHRIGDDGGRGRHVA